MEPSSQPERPRALTTVAAILVVTNFSFAFEPGWWARTSGAEAGLMFALAVFGLVVIGYFARGRNWARWLVMAASVLALIVLVGWTSLTAYEKGVGVFDALLGIGLLYWLNTPAVSGYFRGRSRRLSVGLRAVLGVLVGGTVLLLALGAFLMYMSPSPRPAFGERIAAEHVEQLKTLWPEDERLLGLYSIGAFDIVEEGCLFTDNRVVIYREGQVSRQAAFREITGIALEPNNALGAQSQILIQRRDSLQLFCMVPNAAEYPNDSREFHERLTAAWKAKSGS